MKKNLVIGMCGVVLITAVGVGNTNTSVKASTQKNEQFQKVVRQEVTVSSFNELSDALLDVNVTSINIEGNITFDRSILNIPVRDVTINGQGHTLKMGSYQITGALGTSNGILSVKDTTINNLSATGVPVSDFFTTNDQHWEIKIAGGVDYNGERFLRTPNSMVRFSGKNTVHTSAENAWVRNIIFEENSEYTSSAATAGEFAAFYFNGSLVGGKAVGKVAVEKNAKVDITISPENDNDFYYPAFYDKVDRIDVNEGATLNITAAGHALQFIPRADFEETPSVNIADKATLHLVGHGGGNYSTVSFLQPNSQLNAKEGSTVYIEGKSPNLIETTNNNSINVTNADYDFRNTLAGGHLFRSNLNTRLSLNQVTLDTWATIGGDYQGTPTHSWDKLSLGTIISGNTSSNTTSTNIEAQDVFQISEYGRISGKKEEQKIDSPILNGVNDKDTQLTGTGIPGDTIILTVDGVEIGQATVDAGGKWVYTLTAPLKEGQVVQATQTDGKLVSDPVQQIVTHLSSSTVNYFNLGYWQDYGLILEGQMDNADWDLSDSTKVTRYMNFVSTDGTIALSVNATNTNWFGNPNRYNGYQVIFTNEELSALSNGQYKVQIGTKSDGIDDLQDLHSVNTKGGLYRTTPYRNKFEEIDQETINGKTVTTSVKDKICYITIS